MVSALMTDDGEANGLRWMDVSYWTLKWVREQ